jgi:drug/metabolite transporter (DMT)-like permease
MGALIKLGYSHGISTPELAFYRFAFGLPPLLVWIALSRNFGVWRNRASARPSQPCGAWPQHDAARLQLVAYLPLAESTTIGFAAPFFAVILSALLLKERVGRHRWSAVLIGLAGVIVVMRPGGNDLPTMGLALAMGAALGVGFVTIAIRQIGRTEGTQTTVLWFSLISMLALATLLPFYGKAHDAASWAILLALGTVGGVGQLFLTASLRFAPVPVVVPFDYMQLLWAVLLGWWIFDNHPPATTWAGAAVIIASGLYTVYREHRLGRDKPRLAPPL